jgi:hypothetical protein
MTIDALLTFLPMNDCDIDMLLSSLPLVADLPRVDDIAPLSCGTSMGSLWQAACIGQSGPLTAQSMGA